MPARTRPRIVARPRTGVHKKSAIRALRRAGQVPGLIYGHGEPQPIQIPVQAIREYLRRHAPGAILDLELNGKTTPVLIREVDRDPISGEVIHLGLQRVDLRETVRATLPIVFTGEQVLIDRHLVPQHQITELEVHGRADLLPESIVVDLSRAEAGESIRVGDLELPRGVEAMKDPDLPVATISFPSVPAEVEAALEAEEAARERIAAGEAGAVEGVEEKEGEAATVEMSRSA